MTDGILNSLRYKLINFYPPLRGAGIRVLHRQSDDRTICVRMKLTRFNTNAVGTHFGGSLYAMNDTQLAPTANGRPRQRYHIQRRCTARPLR